MKKLVFILSMVAIVSFFFSCGTTSKLPKMQKDFHNEANKLKRKGGFATVGLGVAPSNRSDLGRSKAKDDALKEMSEGIRAHVDNSVKDFRQEVGADRNAEINDVFTYVVDVVSSNLIEGAMIYKFDAYQEKRNKQEGQYTYLVILLISPEQTYQSLMDEFKSTRGSKENLYQRYVESEARKDHEKMIKEFNESFGKEY